MRFAAGRILSVALISLAAITCSGGTDTTGPSNDKAVSVRDDLFDPSTRTVTIGDWVTWEWHGSHDHNVTWVIASPTGNSNTQTAGTYVRDFSAAGTYSYYCSIHGTPTSGMHGSVVVQ